MTAYVPPDVSMVASADAKKPETVKPEAIIASITGEKYRPKVEEIRRKYQEVLAATDGDHKAAKKATESLKKKLPGVMWSGIFSSRGDKNLYQYSGLVCADLDHIDFTTELDQKLRADRHVWAAFASPTGTGLKVVFRVGGTAAQHYQNFLAVKEHARKAYGLPIDESCNNVERLCFVSYDPSGFINSNAVALEPVEAVETVEAPKKTTVSYVGGHGGDRKQIAEKLLGAIEWKSDFDGIVEKCPGAHLHNTGDGRRDCAIYISGAPTVKCFHDSCRGIIDGVNHAPEWANAARAVLALRSIGSHEIFELRAGKRGGRLSRPPPGVVVTICSFVVMSLQIRFQSRLALLRKVFKRAMAGILDGPTLSVTTYTVGSALTDFTAAAEADGQSWGSLGSDTKPLSELVSVSCIPPKGVILMIPVVSQGGFDTI
jgi:hypothetical protein